MHELADAHSSVQERGHDGVSHRPGALGLASKPLAFDRRKALRRKRLAGDRFQPRSRIRPDAAVISSPIIKPLQRCQGGVHRCGLLSLGEASTVLTQVVAGRVKEFGLVLLPEPDSKTAKVAEVKSSC